MKTTFFEGEAMKKKFVPGPPKYAPANHFEWTRKDPYLTTSRPKGKIGDLKRISFAEEIANKKKSVPAPWKYKQMENWNKSVGKRVKGTQKYSEEKYTYIDEVIHLSKKSLPCNKYKETRMELTMPRSPKASFQPQLASQIGDRLKKISKVSELKIDMMDSFKKTQLRKIHFSNSGSARTTFIDSTVKAKKGIPGAGAYFKDKKKFFKNSRLSAKLS